MFIGKKRLLMPVPCVTRLWMKTWIAFEVWGDDAINQSQFARAFPPFPSHRFCSARQALRRFWRRFGLTAATLWQVDTMFLQCDRPLNLVQRLPLRWRTADAP
jgi:hypothetical protein